MTAAMALPTETARLSFAGVSKSFDATVALDDVSFEVRPGEVHALLGANGAGKSTLIKILAGLHAPDEGSVLMDGATSTGGASFIHQDLGLVETMTVAEAIALTRGYPRRGRLIDWAAVNRQAREVLAAVGASIPVDASIGDLSRADRSIVAIARAITDDCTLLVLDEPTASLPDADVRRLFELIKGLRERGVSVLYVTHRLDEVFEIADRLTVLRDGRVVTSAMTEQVTSDQLVTLIVGTALAAARRTEALEKVEPVLTARDVRLVPERPALGTLVLGRGEILGVAGLRGSGQELLGRGLAGFEPLELSTVEAGGAVLSGSDTPRWLRRNVGFASSKREQEGLAMGLTIRENMFLNPGASGRRFFSWISPRRERSATDATGRSLRLTPNRPEAVSGTLSGGNQQKVILGRWLATDIPILVLEEPTMGIDVGARREIYAVIEDLAAAGRSVVVVSSDYEELSLLCHRVLVLDRGTLAAELRADDITVDNITHYCSGGEGAR